MITSENECESSNLSKMEFDYYAKLLATLESKIISKDEKIRRFSELVMQREQSRNTYSPKLSLNSIISPTFVSRYVDVLGNHTYKVMSLLELLQNLRRFNLGTEFFLADAERFNLENTIETGIIEGTPIDVSWFSI